MQQITSMKITGLTLTDFRNHKKPESYSFDDLTYISGHNGTGKTTMAHGIAYALYGYSYYGEQRIERLMNEQAAGTQVQLDFIDQSGQAHTLIRNRNGDKTALLLDTYTVRQADVDRMFCDRDTFLSMFNPLYLIERLGEKGRAMILKHLKAVPNQDVLNQITGTFRECLDSIDLSHSAPEELLKDYRKSIRHMEDQQVYLEGSIESIEEAIRSAEQKLSALYSEKAEMQDKFTILSKKKFVGIDPDELAIQKDLLITKLAEEPTGSNVAADDLHVKIKLLQDKPYISKYAQAQAKNQAEIKALSAQYNVLARRIKGIKPGTKCPTCLRHITEENLSEVRNSMMDDLKKMAAQGNALVAQGKELEELDMKSKTVFEQFKAEDIKNLTEELAELEKQNVAGASHAAMRSQLEKIEELQQYGNLHESEFSELNALQADLTGIDAQIKAITDIADEKRLTAAQEEAESFKKQIMNCKDMISALTEFICKRTELATAHLQMLNVQIKLFDVIRTTGEVASVFKFTYKGRDYTTLSLSEKTLAGIEITAMIRKITGIDCPICIDNTESIAAFNNVPMPSQTLLLRMVKDTPLTVKSKSRETVQPIQEFKKAS